jgi:hypothetical protein
MFKLHSYILLFILFRWKKKFLFWNSIDELSVETTILFKSFFESIVIIFVEFNELLFLSKILDSSNLNFEIRFLIWIK